MGVQSTAIKITIEKATGETSVWNDGMHIPVQKNEKRAGIIMLAAMCENTIDGLPLIIFLEKLFFLINHDEDKYICMTRTRIHQKFYKEAQLDFLNNEDTPLRIKIMCTQNLLGQEDNKLSYRENEKIVKMLYDIGTSPTIAEELKGDALDVLLLHGSDKDKENTRGLLLNLGETGKKLLSTIYDNSMNAHLASIESSVKQAVNVLNKLECETKMDFDDIIDLLENLCDEKEVPDFEFAIYRIQQVESNLFENYTLMGIFMMIYGYIETHEYRKELELRLKEELVSMSRTCASGYYERLINTLSGYGVELSIGWDEQIQANLIGRLNARIRDSDETDVLLGELTIEHFIDRPELLKLFRKHISSLREEMAEEFSEYINPTDFDLYFRKALVKFEGYNFDDVKPR